MVDILVSDDISWSAWVNNSCFEIRLFDTNDEEIKDEYHGKYKIWVDGVIAAYGGYYSRFETQTICVDNDDDDNVKHISYCITPEYCKNMNIFVASLRSDSSTSSETDYVVKSYRSLTNCNLAKENDISVRCSGMYNLTLNTYSYSAFGMNKYVLMVYAYHGGVLYVNGNYHASSMTTHISNPNAPKFPHTLKNLSITMFLLIS